MNEETNGMPLTTIIERLNTYFYDPETNRDVTIVKIELKNIESNEDDPDVTLTTDKGELIELY